MSSVHLPLDFGRVAQEAISFCIDLVRINTVNPYSGDPQPGGELAGQNYLQPLLIEAGAEVTRFEPPADIYQRMGVLAPRQRVFTDRPNLAAEVTFGDGTGPRILIQGHIDTVGVTGMSIPPFSAEQKDGRIWGRGTSDEKAGLAAAVAALREVCRHKEGLNGSLVLLSVVDEECDGGGAGALACIDRGYRGDCAICVDGPGTSIGLGCFGVATAIVHLHSDGGHAAQIGCNLSALEKGLAVAAAISQFRKERWQQHKVAVNLGSFHSGTHPSLVPVEATLGINISYTYEEAVQAQQAGVGFGGTQVRAAFTRCVQASEPSAEVEWVKDVIPFRIDENAELVGELAAAYKQVVGKLPNRGILQGWSDACWLAQLTSTPILQFGAGTPGQAHTPSEYVDIANVENSARVLATFLYNKLRTV